jgi:hypothetical protein
VKALKSIAHCQARRYLRDMADPKELGQALYNVMDTIQHDWHGREINLAAGERLSLIINLQGAASEISVLLDRLETTKA